MDPEIMRIANQPIIWAVCSVAVIIAVIQSVIFVRISLQTAKKIALPQEICNKAFKTGLTTAIGPSCAIFVVVVGLMSVIGGPMAWQRLAIIGGAPLEIMNAELGAKVSGVPFGPGYTLDAMVISWLTLGFGTQGWMWFVILFGHRLAKVRDKIAGSDPKWLAALSLAAMIAVFGNLATSRMIAGGGVMGAAIGGAIIMVIINKVIIPKAPVFREYALGIAMIGGMCCGALV